MAATNNFLYFEQSGFLTINLTGGTTGGKVLLRLTSLELSQSRDIDETITFDSGQYSKIKNSTYYDWSVSCEGIVSTDTGESEFIHPSSADTRIINTYNGLELVDLIKTRTNSAYIYMKVGPSVYQKGKVIISKMDIKSQAGQKITYSLQLTGSGDLTSATS
jgi:hypothetical protein